MTTRDFIRIDSLTHVGQLLIDENLSVSMRLTEDGQKHEHLVHK